MYNINQLMRNVLITPAEVVFHAPTKQTLDPRTILNSIIIAEERFVRPALGFDLYNDLVNSKNQVVDNTNIAALQGNFPTGITLKVGDIVNAFEFFSAGSLSLWKQYLWKLTAEAVLLIAFPEGWIQFGSDGIVHPNAPAGPMGGGQNVSPDLRSVKWARDTKLADRIEPLREAMHLWLCSQNQNVTPKPFPLYTQKCACDDDGVATKRKTDLILGLYDDDDNCDCGTWGFNAPDSNVP